ncbi:MAG TPA: flagella basal body P-ring formation protein FlgA [Terriglobales bacterium]|nr:flagella basal body P-ring formation protein FlgA [Terriglobales bacterium]
MVARVIRQMVAVAALSAFAGGAPVAQSDRVTVSREQVAHAMQAAGFETTADQLEFLSNVTSTAGARLRVAKVTTQSADTALARLNCPARECLPFYVLVHDSQVAATPSRSAHASDGEKAKEQPLVKRGKSVTLLIENTDLRIVLPAISLEAGTRGQVIKVTSPDHKRNYRAEVLSEKLVRSKF